ncbi:MAG: coproporphyrinogen III oxidase, partial [Actinomycetota bacterium]|nr:coproporphyrinogen III oxidase [Actinomycetota bacterium]
WWNVKHPHTYATALASGHSPGKAREVLDDDARRTEDILLRLRLAAGLSLTVLRTQGRHEAQLAAREGLLEPDRLAAGTAVLTVRGRLLADGIAIRLLD